MARPLKVDWTGKRIGFLTVVGRVPSVGGQARWLCKCKCGNDCVVSGSSFLKGNTRSCGCFRRAFVTIAKTTHGLRHRPEYQVWNAMKQRCYNPNQAHYERYGGRGITICAEWRDSFETFYKDMGPRPPTAWGKRYTIERIDNDGPYAPWNCKWATYFEQQKNVRRRKKPKPLP